MDSKSDAPSSKSSAATTDDDSISTSTTESETFGTWTLVTDKHKKTNSATTNTNTNDQTNNNRVDVLKPDTDTEERDKVAADADMESKAEEESTVDDLSDGISIISESESAGRVSPHPYLREHLGDLNLKFDIFQQDLPQMHRTPPNSPITLTTASFADGAEDNNTCELRQRRTNRSSSEGNALERCTTTATATADANADRVVSRMPPAIRRGLTGIFYLAVALALLAFIGKLRYPEWEPLAHHKSIDELEQKLNDMELQNNLMRAEIDLLSKQVNYLNLLNERGGRNAKAHEGKREWRKDTDVRAGQKADTFTAWSGIGASLDPVEITKGDLKRPYKCADGKFVEIAGMCVENASEKADAFVDEIGNVVDDVLKQSDFFEGFDDVLTKVDAFTNEPEANKDERKVVPKQFETKIKGTPEGSSGAATGQQGREKRESGKFKNIKVGDYNSKERHRHDDPVQKQKSLWNTPLPHSHEHRSDEYDDDDDDDDDDGHVSAGSMEDDDDDDNDDDDDDDDSFENTFKYNSKERVGKYKKPHEFANKMPKQYKIYKFDDDKLNLDKDGHWHEKHMQNREYARRQNERHRNNKNWFIERGDGREQMRHS